MTKNRVIVFSEDGARILVNPENIDSLAKQSNVLVNPDLNAVSGLTPALWVLEKGRVVPLAKELQASQLARLLPHPEHKPVAESITLHLSAPLPSAAEAPPTITYATPPAPKKASPKLLLAAGVALAVAAAIIYMRLHG